MAEGKRYYWLKLYDDFFGSMRIKKLRKMAGGDTYVIIYLKMQLKAMKTDGVLHWSGLEDSIVDELALDLDEEPDNVKVTLAYLLHCGLAESSDNTNFFFPYAVANTGSEGSSAKRVRDHRERKALQSNSDVTLVKQIGNGEKEIELEIEKETDTEEEKEKENNNSIFLSDGEKNEKVDLRKKAYEESDLPYSFDYKVRHAFHKRKCPMCGMEMLNVEKGPHRPTIQHNFPISRGGKHELSNISVICYSCNIRNRAKPTGPLNNAEVVEEWKRISGEEEPKAPAKTDLQMETVKYWHDRLEIFKRQGFETEGVYNMAAAYGVTRADLDNYKEGEP